MHRELFLMNFNFYPDTAILLFDQSHLNIKSTFEIPIQACNGHLDIKEYNASLHLVNRKYEYVVMFDTLQNVTDKKAFFKQCFNALELVADIFIFEKKSVDAWEIEAVLGDIDFTAINTTDFSETYNMISAKKLLMWGC